MFDSSPTVIGANFGSGRVQLDRRPRVLLAPDAGRHRPGHRAGRRGPGDRRPPRRRRGAGDPELRPGQGRRAGGRHGPPGRPLERADVPLVQPRPTRPARASRPRDRRDGRGEPPRRRGAVRRRPGSHARRTGRPAAVSAELRWGPLFAALDGETTRCSSRRSSSSTRATSSTTAPAAWRRSPPATGRPALLAGDVFYAHGLRLVAARGDVQSVALLTRLMSACSCLRSPGGALRGRRRALGVHDGRPGRGARRRAAG